MGHQKYFWRDTLEIQKRFRFYVYVFPKKFKAKLIKILFNSPLKKKCPHCGTKCCVNHMSPFGNLGYISNN